MPVVTVFEQHAQKYDQWFDQHADGYQAEIRAVRNGIPLSGLGVEIDVGTGRFAASLGIKLEIDPSGSNSQRRSTHCALAGSSC